MSPRDLELDYDAVLEIVQDGIVDAYMAAFPEQQVVVLTVETERVLHETAKLSLDGFLARHGR